MKAEILKHYIGCQMFRGGTPDCYLLGLRYNGRNIETSTEVTLEYADGDEHTFPKDDIKHKPYLRKTSDMKEEEVNKILSIMVGKDVKATKIEWVEPERTFIIATFGATLKSENSNYDTINLEIQINRHLDVNYVWAYNSKKGTGIADQKLPNYSEITTYLLSRNFDVFGLMEEGLAFDIKESEIGAY